MVSEADAGDAAAGDLVAGEGLAVFVSEVDEAMGLGGLFQPMDESFHLGVDDFLCASEADTDYYERHVGNSEMAFGAFPETELDGAVLAEVVDAASDRVPVECGFIGVAAEYFENIGAEVEEEVHDCVAGCRFDFLHCRIEVKGLNMRFCIRAPDSVRQWVRGSRRQCGGIRWLLPHRVTIKIRHRLLPEVSLRAWRCGTRKR